MKKFLLFSLITIFTFQVALAQYAGAKHGLGFRLVNTNYHWPITKDFSTMDFAGIGLEIEYSRHLNDFLNLSVPFRMYKAHLPIDGKDRFQRNTSLIGLDLLLQLKLFKESNFFYPYLYTGLRGVGENVSDDFSFLPLSELL